MVTFMEGNTTLGSATLINGTASLTISSLPAGSDSITAIYDGDDTFRSSVSMSATQTVTPASLTVTANSVSRAYGSPDPPFTASYSGFVLGQTLGSNGVKRGAQPDLHRRQH